MDSRSRARSKPKLDSRSRVHSKPEVDSAEGDRPSQWREKYGSKPCTTKNQCGHEVESSLTDWIATVRENANKENKVPGAYFASLVTDSVPADEDAVDVISQMNKLLDGDDGLSCRHINVDLHDFDFHQNSDFDCADDFDTEFTSYLQASSIQAERRVNSAPLISPHGEAFSGESMAILFRRSHDEKFTRKCLDCLLSITKENKMLRGRVFSSWKRIAKEAKDADDILVRRFQRRHRLRHTRRLFSSWLNVGAISHEILKRAVQIRVLQISHKVFIAWSKWSRLSRRKKSRRAEDIQRMDMASNIHSTKLKRSFFVGWLGSKRENNSEVKSRKVESSPHEVKETRRIAIVEEDDSSAGIGQTVTPKRTVPPAMSEARDTSEPEVKHTTECFDGKENQPIRTKESNMFIPLNPQRRKMKIPSTPNLVLRMNQRKEERERGREVLRQRYERKAIEKHQRLEEQRLQREESETKVQREFVQRKTIEEQRKRMATERQKRACRLAALHYQICLQKRMLLQWKNVFQIQDFQVRKVRKEKNAIINQVVLLNVNILILHIFLMNRPRLHGVTQRMKNVGTDGYLSRTKEKEGEANVC